jgi:hypothetical protein
MKTLLAVIVGVVAIGFGAVCDAAPISSQPVYTNKLRFRIPYRFDAAEMRTIGAREIRLFLSVNQGLRWQHIQTVTPVAGHFEFQATGDGKYWFAVRTVDTRGRLHPQQAVIQPGLKVVVDTKQPILNIVLKQFQPGTVRLEWSALDAHLDLSSLRLEYIQPGWQSWKQVAVTPQATGQTSWKVHGGGLVAVRGHIRDSASNETMAQNRVQIVPVRQIVPKPSVPDFSQPIASSGNAGKQFQQTRNRTAPQSNPVAKPRSPLPTVPPFKEETASSNKPNRRESNILSNGFEKTIPDTNTFASSGSQVIPRKPGVPAKSVSDITKRRTQSFASAASGTMKPNVPIGKKTRVVNSRKFQIGYRIDDVGASGISRVELFITASDGKKWFKYGEDADRTSPFEVEIPAEGRYGFMLRAHSGLGLASLPPQSGDNPAISVIVDKTPPKVELLPIQQGRGDQIHQLSIRWKVTDDFPTEKPIALSYSTDPSGPWEPITGWMSNSGSYLWSTGPGMPSRLFIRLTARDAAGNMTRRASTNPVIVDLSKPAARIVDVEPIKPPRLR